MDFEELGYIFVPLRNQNENRNEIFSNQITQIGITHSYPYFNQTCRGCVPSSFLVDKLCET